MKKIILLVDDDSAMVDLLATLFLQNGWLPQRATSGEDALSSVALAVPQAVVCDLNMPGISGFDVAASLRLSCGAQCPALIAFSACPDRDVSLHAMNAGFDAVVAKPVEFDRLLSAVLTSLKVNRVRHRKSVADAHALAASGTA